MAVAIRSPPTTSPIMMRRSALSVAQALPLTKQDTARCQTSSRPVQPRTAMAADDSSVATSTPSSPRLRSIRSAIAPENAPNSAIGKRRSSVIIVTINAEPVT